MKYAHTLILPLLFVTFCSCKNTVTQSAREYDTDSLAKLMTADTSHSSGNHNWQENFHLTHNPEKDTIAGRPVSYYINRSDCHYLAINFYYGKYRPSDNDSTEKLLSLAITRNKELRPFYRWCLERTLEISDGALGEYTGAPARKYIETYPKEFLNYIGHDTAYTYYKEWISSISYSGFYENEDFNDRVNIKKNFLATTKMNCSDCNEQEVQLIEKIAFDSFNKTEEE